jgi:hypothetical protein
MEGLEAQVGPSDHVGQQNRPISQLNATDEYEEAEMSFLAYPG